MREADQRKDEFLAILAHELRNPLATVATSAATLRKNPKAGRRQRLAETIDRQVAHLRRIVDDLLDVTRLRLGKVKLKKEPLEIAEQMQMAAQSVSKLIKQKRHQLRVVPPDAQLFVEADPIRLQQILVNLLQNAVTYTGNGGEISLIAFEENGFVVCKCRDTGRGIDPDQLAYLFQPFMQLHHQEAGLGIGLAMVKQLVELHGGSVEATSLGRGKGSEFTIRLPMTSLPTEEKRASGRPTVKKPKIAKRHILLAEDNEVFAQALKVFLEDEGHRVWVVDNGKDAITSARDNQPDVVVLDIGLPDRDGYTVAEKIRQLPQLQHTLFIAMSGYDPDKRKSKGLFDSYFVKSNDPETLLDMVQKDRAGRS